MPTAFDAISLPEQLSKAGRWACCFRRFPVFGLNTRVRQEICKQLKRRSSTFTEVNWDDQKARAIAESIARIIESYFAWPNAHFLPSDPMRLLLFECGDGFVGVTTLLKIEEEFGISGEGIANVENMTFGEFVAALRDRVSQNHLQGNSGVHRVD